MVHYKHASAAFTRLRYEKLRTSQDCCLLLCNSCNYTTTTSFFTQNFAAFCKFSALHAEHYISMTLHLHACWQVYAVLQNDETEIQ